MNKINDNSLRPSISSTYKEIYEIKLSSYQQENYLEVVKKIASYKGVYHVEPVYTFSAAVEPNDPYFLNNNLWGLNGKHGIRVPSAWKFSTGSSSVRVGVIDTGIYNRADLVDNLVQGWDVYTGTTNTSDDVYGHGTHVAGTIGAVGNNGLGIVGVNWRVSLVPIQANDGVSNKFSTTDLVYAINLATELWYTDNRIHILNYSISGYGYSVCVREAVRDFPGLFVWAAGNEREDIDTRVNYYGTFDLPNIISVGALNSDGERSLYSNYSSSNKNVHIYAPGDVIYSTLPINLYGANSGTSMAAPHVTGVAALLLSVNPNLTASQLKDIIINNATSITILIPKGIGEEVYQTVKRLNAHSALQFVVTHTHSYTHSHRWYDLGLHRSICICGDSKLNPHVVSSDWDGRGYTKCLLCGGLAEIGVFTFGKAPITIYASEYFGNGSVVLPNGVIVLSDEDLENFYDGTLLIPDCCCCCNHHHEAEAHDDCIYVFK